MERKKLEQGYNYLDSPGQSMASDLSINKKNKTGSKKRKVITQEDSEDEETEKEMKG